MSPDEFQDLIETFVDEAIYNDLHNRGREGVAKA